MAPPQHNKGRKRFVDRRETKSADIKRALTHRARLRKNYFKLLKHEGLEEPSKDKSDTDGESDNDEEEEGDVSHEKHESRPKQSKPTSFAERAAIAKQRKAEKRNERLQKIQEKLTDVARQEKIRELKKKELSQKTKRGQPVMGPRINNLLEKIKKNNE
ncbi:Fyv7 protein [Candida orthopsilosis Co 90-125]|uniref:rRNA-processing protein FYV7 n=1 Tax=Candida orthopsilosis (strain 90-125) TaxID=1136231 RepID=H8X0K6_CANO9|nr:Fyv7 protein [Candida orthopsilosis Co 90-125]CCG21895.1 Fyv7 protein [Candida orthopsilosis Co 90-125]